jgi:hypothetical protein
VIVVATVENVELSVCCFAIDNFVCNFAFGQGGAGRGAHAGHGVHQHESGQGRRLLPRTPSDGEVIITSICLLLA